MKRHYRSRHSGARRTHLAVLGLIGSLIMSLALSITLPSSAHAQRLDPSPTFAIVNPLYSGIYGGPVDTNVTVRAQSGWTTGASVALSIEPDGTACDPSTATPVQPISGITVDSGGAFTGMFRWPSVSAVDTAGQYRICANESGTGTQKGTSSNAFNVLTSAAGSPSAKPTVSVSAAAVTSNGTLTVTGANWVPSQPITLILQFANATLAQDPGTPLTPKPNSDSSGNFTTTVTIPPGRVNQQWILAVAGTQYQGTGPYPLMENSQPFTVSLATPTPTIAPTSIPTAVPTVAASLPQQKQPSGDTTPLIILIGLIALVLLIAGVVVAVLAMRGRNQPNQTQGPGSGATWGNPGNGGPPGQVWNDNYGTGNAWDETQAGPPPGWGGWQQPPGQPWSGRESRPYSGQMPPAGNSYDDDTYEDDPYRTRMGEPFQPPNGRPQPGGPPLSRPNNTSRPMSNNVPPRSGPRPPASTEQNWQSPWDDGDTGQDTNAGWPPNPPPPRR